MAIEDILRDMQKQITDLQEQVTAIRKIEKSILTPPTIVTGSQDTVNAVTGTSGVYYDISSVNGWTSNAPKGLILLIARYYLASYAQGRTLFRFSNNGSSWSDIGSPAPNATHSLAVNDGERILVGYHINSNDRVEFKMAHLGEGASVTYGYAAGDGRWARRWMAIYLGNNV